MMSCPIRSIMTTAKKETVAQIKVGLRPARVLVFTNRFPPSPGGVSMAAYELARSFCKLGYSVYIATLENSSENLDIVNSHEYKVYRFDASLHGANIAQWVKQVFDGVVPDIALLNGYGVYAFSGIGETFVEEFLRCSSGRHIPIVYRSHGANTTMRFHVGNPPFFGVPTWIRAFVMTRLWIHRCRSFQTVVFLSNKSSYFNNYDRLVAMRIKLDNVVDLPNTFPSLQTHTLSDFRDKYNISGTLFLCIAMFGDTKNQLSAIRAIRHTKIQDATFLFVGPTRNQYAVASEKAARGDKRIRFLYNLSRSDVIAAHNSCDCEFLFSRQEQQPIVLLEAMSCGKPWFCPNVGSVSDLRGGIVLPRRSVRAFCHAVELMTNRDARNSYGEEGIRYWHEKYSPEVVDKAWDQILKNAISSTQTP